MNSVLVGVLLAVSCVVSHSAIATASLAAHATITASPPRAITADKSEVQVSAVAGCSVSRSSLCSVRTYNLNYFDKNNVKKGTLIYDLYVGQTFDPKSLMVAVQYTMTRRGVQGSPANGIVTLQPANGTIATLAVSTFLPVTSSGSATYIAPLGTAELVTISAYDPAGGATTGATTIVEPDSARCDNSTQISGSGCVNPTFKPILVTMSQLPYIDKNIRAAQSSGQPGVPGGIPITRANSTVKKQNRAAACSTARIAQILGAKPSMLADPTCDEYPFASTYEGGVNASIAWVPRAEQSREEGEENDNQGELLGDFYRQYRLLDGDQFYVQP